MTTDPKLLEHIEKYSQFYKELESKFPGTDANVHILWFITIIENQQ